MSHRSVASESARQKSRPVSGDDEMRRLRAVGEREVSSRLIGDWVMDALRELDEVAYVRFASVYRSFQDVNAFREEIGRMEQTSETKKG